MIHKRENLFYTVWHTSVQYFNWIPYLLDYIPYWWHFHLLPLTFVHLRIPWQALRKKYVQIRKWCVDGMWSKHNKRGCPFLLSAQRSTFTVLFLASVHCHRFTSATSRIKYSISGNDRKRKYANCYPTPAQICSYRSKYANVGMSKMVISVLSILRQEQIKYNGQFFAKVI